ncbi:MAG: hypothetical protein HOO95_09735 [Gallionella sp.]|nr:hypothetical protein [Gallionella sp.]
MIEQLANRLNPQAGKSLVIPRKRESSKNNIPRSGQRNNAVPLRGEVFNYLDSRFRGNDGVKVSVHFKRFSGTLRG